MNKEPTFTLDEVVDLLSINRSLNAERMPYLNIPDGSRIDLHFCSNQRMVRKQIKQELLKRKLKPNE